MMCPDCGKALYYTGGCLGEWEHSGGKCEKKDIKHCNLTKLKMKLDVAKREVRKIKKEIKND